MTSDLPTEDCCSNSIVEADGNVEMRRSAAPSKPKKLDETLSLSSDESTEMDLRWISFSDDNTESSWESYKYVDLRYTLISNLFFFVGASIQTYTNLVDLKSAQADWMLDDDDAWDDDAGDDYVITATDKVWYVMYSLGPFLYIVNACIDARWSMEYLAWSYLWSWWCSCFRNTSNNNISSSQNSTPQQEGDYYQRIQEIEEVEDTGADNDSSSSYFTDQSSLSSNYESEACWQVVVAVIFGLGAVFEFYSTFLDDHYEDQDDGYDDDTYLIANESKRKWYVSNYVTNFIGMHLYLLSGVIELLSQQKSYRSRCRVNCFGRYISCNGGVYDESQSIFSSERVAQYLMFFGTLLFICGTLLDCTVAYLADPGMRHDLDPSKKVLWHVNEVTLATSDVISSVLWNVDAVLYIMADILLYNLHKKKSKGRKWLCEKLNPCRSTEDQEDGNEEDWIENTNQDGDFTKYETETRAQLLPVFESKNNDDKQSLLNGSKISNYSTL